MNKVLCTLLFLAVVGVAQCESFMRIPIDQGKVFNRRRLETTAAPAKIVLENKTEQTTVNVKINEAFLTANEIKADTATPVTVFLTVSESGFCENCFPFVPMKCAVEKECKTNNEVTGKVGHSRIGVSGAFPIVSETPFVTLTNGQSTPWSSKAQPLAFSNGPFFQVGSTNLPEKATYGFIGLGVEDGSRQNFATQPPLFSVKLDSDRKGNLIFGNDTTQIQANRKYLTWNTSAAWVAKSKGFSFEESGVIKDKVSISDYETKVHFDLNQVGTTLRSNAYDAIEKALNLTSHDTFNTWKYKRIYYANVSAPISKLPAIVLTLENQKVIIPFEALFNKTGVPNVYNFVADRESSTRKNYKTGDYEYPTVFGTYFMSNFYTVFSSPTDKEFFVTLHPSYTAYTDSVTSSSGSGVKFLIGLIAVIGLGAVGFIVFKNKAASRLQEHLNEK